MIVSLRKIAIANFCSVRGRLVLDFTSTLPGLYFVRGDAREDQVDARLGSNGKGKSTLFVNSIIWALTGSMPGDKRPGGKVESRGVTGETRVEFEVALDSQISTVVRTRNPNGLYLNGEKVEQRDVDALLPLTEAALRKSILIDQFGEMFLSLRPEAQSQVFTETLDLDKWLRASDAAGLEVTSSAKLLATIQSNQEGAKRVFAEVHDQFEVARKGEESFEAGIKVEVVNVRKEIKAAKVEQARCRDELNAARGKWADGQDDQIIELNDTKYLLRKLNGDTGNFTGKKISADNDLARLNKQLSSYAGNNLTVCPECGQKVDAKHVKEKRAMLLGSIEGAKQRLKNADKELTSLDKQIQEVEGRIVELEAAAEAALIVQGDVAVAAERSLAWDRGVHRLNVVLAELKGRVNPFTKSCDKLEERVKEIRAELKALKAREQATAEELDIAKFWMRGFKEIRLAQIDTALEELELATNSYAESLGLEGWQIQFWTERETKKGTVSHGFTVALYSPDSKEPVSLNSGGEMQRWQLATTFGLAEVLLARAGIATDFEVLDEPTTHLSPEGVDDLLTCLQDRARDLNRRIFLIDHASHHVGNFDGVITIAKTKERGTYIADAGGVLQLGKPKRERAVL